MTLMQDMQTDRQRLVQQVRRWGDFNTDALLDAACKTFAIPEVDGFIGYRIEAGNAIVFGEPVCAPAEKPIIAKAFEHYCRRQGYGVVYAIVTEEFAESIMNPEGAILIEFGERSILDPTEDPLTKTGSKAVLVRKKVKRATGEGVIVKEYLPEDANPALEKSIEDIGESWLKARHGAQVYIAHITLFSDRQGKRWFYAAKGDQIVGILILNQLGEQNGWLLNNLMITPDAPSGTSELLVVAALKTLGQEECRYVIYGPIPARQLGKVTGLGKITLWLIRKAYKFARKLFRLDGQGTFWDKFQPQTAPSYLLFNEKRITPRMIIALMRAMNASF